MTYIEYLCKFIKAKVQEANAQGIVVGISGGIDSALVVSLAKKALGDNFLGLIMPIDNMSFDLEHITKLEQNLNVKFKTVNLTKINRQLNEIYDLKNDMAIANIKPRLRMTTLYALAQEKNYLVAGTDNLDEFYIGYFTKYGDGGADILPISHLTKGEVRFLASLLDVPQEIINKKPSAGLWEGQSDEDELGFSYADLDFYLDHLDNKEILKKHLSKTTITKIEKLHNNSVHKRSGAYRPFSINELNK